MEKHDFSADDFTTPGFKNSFREIWKRIVEDARLDMVAGNWDTLERRHRLLFVNLLWSLFYYYRERMMIVVIHQLAILYFQHRPLKNVRVDVVGKKCKKKGKEEEGGVDKQLKI